MNCRPVICSVCGEILPRKMREVFDAAMALYAEMGEVDPELFSGRLLALREACRPDCPRKYEENSKA